MRAIDTFAGKNWLFRHFLKAARRDNTSVRHIELQFKDIATHWSRAEAYQFVMRK